MVERVEATQDFQGLVLKHVHSGRIEWSAERHTHVVMFTIDLALCTL